MTHCHLDPRVAELVDRPIEERIGYILADKYIPYPLAEHRVHPRFHGHLRDGRSRP